MVQAGEWGAIGTTPSGKLFDDHFPAPAPGAEKTKNNELPGRELARTELARTELARTEMAHAGHAEATPTATETPSFELGVLRRSVVSRDKRPRA